MGIPAAISFVLAGLALLIFSRRDGRGATAAQGLALAICFIALLGTIGYLYGAHVLYAVAHLTGIAWPTALALLTLGLGLLLARPTEGLMAQVTADDPGGANLRRWVPVMLLPAVLGWLRLAGERQGVFDAATGTAIMMIIFIVCLAVLAYAGSRPVSRSLADLRESEERYRSLFGSMAEAFALHEILTDAGGQPIDYRFLEVNDSFERMTGLKRSDVVGRTVREVLPKIDHSWIETYGRVALTGEAVNFEKYYPAPLNRWYEVFAYQPAPRQFAAVFLDVSQRKRSEEELRASETRLRRFYESGLLGVIYWNMNGQITDANTKFLEMVGYDRQDLEAGRIDWAKMTPPEYRHLDEQSAAELKSTGVNKRPFEKAYIRKDGMQLPVIVAGAMLDEARSKGVAFVLDITERKRAEAAISEAKEQLEVRVRERTAELTEALQALRQTGNYTRSLIEASVDPLVTIGRDGRITDVNAATETVTGRVRQELIGTDFSMYFTEPEKARTGYQQVFKDRSVRDYPLEIRRRDGRTIPVLYNAALFRDESGEVVGIFAAARDITERKRTEEALRRSEQEFRTLAEAVPQIVWATRPDGWTIYFNKKWVDYTGLTLEESYGHGWNTPFHPDDRKRAWDAWKHATQGGTVYSLECRLRRADGIYRWWLIRGEPMRDANGNILKWFGTCTDIEDLKQASELLRRVTSELLVAEQRERQRLAQVLHDGLQQILVGAKYHLVLLERGQNIQQVTGQVVELIDDAIETSRSLSLELSPPILLQRDFVSALEWLASWMQDKHGIEVKLMAPSEIVHLKEDAILLLFQAARELLLNVVKHAGVKNAHIEVNQLHSHVSMTVADKGVGFDQNILALRGGKSSGTGLFGISERLSYIGGKIEIDSAPGLGSRFRLLVPIPEANAERGQGTVDQKERVSVAIPPQIDSRPAGVEKKIRIALVDDHIVVRQGLAGLLRCEPDFAIVGEASDGQSAIDLVRELEPDVVLMDISMPGMDGIQATRIIHKEFPRIRIIGLSMFQEAEQQAAMHEAGAANYLNKSWPSETLIEAIRASVRVSEHIEIG
jgi:PAS domain S-box-containing protein